MGRTLIEILGELKLKWLVRTGQAICTSDLLMNAAREQVVDFLLGNAVTMPGYIAVGTETVGDDSSLTALQDELERVQITSKQAETYKARYVGIFGNQEGVGTWREAGLFDSPARAVMLHNCDDDTNWTSANTLSVSTTNVQEGAGSLRSYGPNTLSFENTALSPSYGSWTFTNSDKLQLWYYAADTSILSGNVDIYIGSGADWTTDYYKFSIAPANLSNGWNWLSLIISSGTVVGSPNLNAITRFKLESPKSADLEEYIDKIRLFGTNGVMWARIEFQTPIQKQYGEVRNVYWYLAVG